MFHKLKKSATRGYGVEIIFYDINQDLRKNTNCSVNIGSGLSKIHHI